MTDGSRRDEKRGIDLILPAAGEDLRRRNECFHIEALMAKQAFERFANGDVVVVESIR